MIQISGLFKTFGTQTIFENASCVLNARERVGLVGRNGSGKSTLFKLILDEEHADSGLITYPKGYRIGRLSQHLSFTEKSCLDEVCLGLPEDERDQRYRGEIILSGLGFSEEDMEQPPENFSGGFQIRLNLARLLLSEPNLLLLDEPTNYLDIVSSRWLASTLRAWKGELIVITHDRSFMDSVTTHTMLIYRGGFRKISGKTEKLYEAIAVDEEVYEKTRVNEDKKRKEMEQFINRFRAKASKASIVQSRVKALEKITVKEELRDEATLDFQFAGKQFFGKTLVDVMDLSFGYDPALPLVSNLSFSVGKSDRVGIIGKNGRGKSTLLRLLADELQPLEGSVTKSPSTSLAYFGQTNIDRLDSRFTVEDEISSAHPGMHRTKIRSICGTVMFDGDKALKKISVLSGGERSRVLLGKIIVTPSNLLMLDEPTNHLDLESVEALKDALEFYEGAVVLVTHNEMLLKEVCTRLVVFQGDVPFVFEGDYDQFLKKIGWEDEGPSQPVAPSKKISKEKESVPTKDKDKQLKQIEKTIEKLEQKIISLEEKQKEIESELLEVTKNSNTKKIQELSVQLHGVHEAIEKAFAELSKSSQERKEIL